MKIILIILMFLTGIQINDMDKIVEENNNVSRIIEDESNKGFIFIGDSRFTQMDNFLHLNNLNENYFVVAKPSMGYYWLITEAKEQINQLKNEHSEIEKWVMISNLGVNDLHNAKLYKEEYEKLANDMEIIFVSVFPVEDYSTILDNKDIEEFNKIVSDSKYITTWDGYQYLSDNGFSTVDKLHFTDTTYKDIYEYLNSKINSD